VTWKGEPANLIGNAIWQARKGRVLAESKTLQNFEGENWCPKKVIEVRLARFARKASEEKTKAKCKDLHSKLTIMHMLR